MRWPLGCLVVAAIFVSGCVSPTNPSPAGDMNPTDSLARQASVVVALVDTGIQPYHEVFRLPEGLDTSWLEGLPGLKRVPAEFAEHAVIPGEWKFEKNVLYWFEGTRVLAVSTSREADQVLTGPGHVIYDDRGHGTMTASVIAQASPHAFILMVEWSSYNGTLEWVRAQPWIDIVSMSVGQPPALSLTNAAIDGAYSPPWVLLDMVRDGKMVFKAAGNEPAPTLFGEESLPWVITVGGGVGQVNGTTPYSSIPPDFVANYTQTHLADARDLSGYRDASGTSFSAPAAAAVAAETIYQLRIGAGHAGSIRDGALVHDKGRAITQADVRAALNASAVYWTPEEYRTEAPSNPPYWDAPLPVLPTAEGTPVGPWVQMGWGWLDPSVIPTALAILRGEVEPPPKPGAADYMATQYALREAYWGLPVHQ